MLNMLLGFNRKTLLKSAPVMAAKASMTTEMTGLNCNFTLTAKEFGTLPNYYIVKLVDPETANYDLSFTMENFTVTFFLATDGAGLVTTTANELLQFISADETLSTLFDGAPIDGDSGDGVVTPMEKQFRGGKLGTVWEKEPGVCFVDSSFVYFATGKSSYTDSNFKKVAMTDL